MSILAVYRGICRHVNYIDPKLLKPIRAQFERRKKFAKEGHLRAAVELENELWMVTHDGMTLQQLLRKWQKPKGPEANAASRRQLWLGQRKQRQLDLQNPPPRPGTLEYLRVDAAAKLHNQTNLFLHSRGIALPKDSVSRAVVETCLVPYTRRQRRQKKMATKAARESSPRLVKLKVFMRDGARVSVLHTQGIKSPRRRFSALMNAVNRNSRRLGRMRANPDSGGASADTKRLLRFKDMEAAQQAIMQRRVRLRQKHWDYMYRLHKQNKLSKEPKRLRLRDL